MNIKYINYSFLILVCCLCVVGCSKKRYFEPQDVHLQTEFSDTLPAPITHTSRVGAVLKNLDFLDSKGNISVQLQKNQRFLAQQDTYYLVQDSCNNLLLIDSVSKIQNEIEFGKCVVSASILVGVGNTQIILALVGADNSIVVYDVLAKREIFSQKLSNVIAINTLNASPIFDKDKIIFPTLDGKIVIFDRTNNVIMRDILIQSDKFFNNIMYLYIKNDMIIAATPKRISTILSNSKTFNYDGDFIDMLIFNNKLYVLNNDGNIVELDHTLKPLREAKLEYARLHSIVIQDNKLYTLESNKYLIELDLESFLPVVYKVSLPKRKHIFYTQDSIFYDKFYKRF